MKKTLYRGLNDIRIRTDFFKNPEMVVIRGRFGALGLLFTMALICEIHRNGYFLYWDRYTLYSLLADVPGFTDHQAIGLINELASMGLIDAEMLKNNNVITSANIQQIYFSRRRPKPGAEYEYLLIELNASATKNVSSNGKNKPEKSCENVTSDTNVTPNERSQPIMAEVPKPKPPTLSEVHDAIRSGEFDWIGATHGHALGFYDHFAKRGWLDDTGKPIFNWKDAFFDWIAADIEESA